MSLFLSKEVYDMLVMQTNEDCAGEIYKHYLASVLPEVQKKTERFRRKRMKLDTFNLLFSPKRQVGHYSLYHHHYHYLIGAHNKFNSDAENAARNYMFYYMHLDEKISNDYRLSHTFVNWNALFLKFFHLVVCYMDCLDNNHNVLVLEVNRIIDDYLYGVCSAVWWSNPQWEQYDP